MNIEFTRKVVYVIFLFNKFLYFCNEIIAIDSKIFIRKKIVRSVMLHSCF